MSSVTLALVHPVDWGNGPVTSIQVRRPKVKDMLTVEHTASSDAEKEIHLFANLCEVSPEQLMELDMADYAQLQETYQGFLSSGKRMSEKPL